MIILPHDIDILSPIDDHIFKTLMMHPDAKPALISIISASIDRPVIDAEVRNNELPISDDSEKGERLDVNCTIEGGDQVDVEMHGSRSEEVDDVHTNFFNKYVYYLTDLHSSQKSKGIPYYKLVRTYQVTFCNYEIYPNRTDFITRATLRSADGFEVSNQINFILFELSKLEELLKKSPCELSSLEQWCIFLRFAADTKRRDVVNKVIAERSEIAVAGTKLKSFNYCVKQKTPVTMCTRCGGNFNFRLC